MTPMTSSLEYTACLFQLWKNKSLWTWIQISDWTTAMLIMEKGLRQLDRLTWRWRVCISGELFCSWGTRRQGVLTFLVVNIWACFASVKERQVVKVLSLLLIHRTRVHFQTSESTQHKHAEKRNDYISQFTEQNRFPRRECDSGPKLTPVVRTDRTTLTTHSDL